MLEKKQLPFFKSKKTVQALKIRAITIVPISPGGRPDDISWYLHFEDYHYPPVAVTNEWRTKHNPQSGGYYVKYKGGYESYHPCKTFEDGHVMIDPSAVLDIKEASVRELMEELSKRPEIKHSEMLVALTQTAREGIKSIFQWIENNKEVLATAAEHFQRRERDNRLPHAAVMTRSGAIDEGYLEDRDAGPERGSTETQT